MPVDNTNIIDFVAINPTTGDANLVISDHLKWDKENEHLLILQSKINSYLEGIENGSLYEGYPDAKNRNIIIEITAQYEPSEMGRTFLSRTETDLKAAGYGFSFSVLKVDDNPLPGKGMSLFSKAFRFLSKSFDSSKIECPRCLGKGNVDLDDIKRLRKELHWLPGKCAYCAGVGKVPSTRESIISADTSYLTTDTPGTEKCKLLAGDKCALQRGKEHEAEVNKLIQDIEHLYYIENQEPDEIAAHFLEKYTRPSSERQETVEYIKKVITSKLRK